MEGAQAEVNVVHSKDPVDAVEHNEAEIEQNDDEGAASIQEGMWRKERCLPPASDEVPNGVRPEDWCVSVSPRQRLVIVTFGDGPEHIRILLLLVIIVVSEYEWPLYYELENTGTLDSWF